MDCKFMVLKFFWTLHLMWVHLFTLNSFRSTRPWASDFWTSFHLLLLSCDDVPVAIWWKHGCARSISCVPSIVGFFLSSSLTWRCEHHVCTIYELWSKDHNQNVDVVKQYLLSLVSMGLLLEHRKALSGVIVPFCVVCLLLGCVFGHFGQWSCSWKTYL